MERSVSDLLKDCKLYDQYAGAFHDAGYDDDLPFLLEHLALDDDKLENLARQCGLKPGHALRFVYKLREWARGV